MVECSHEAYSKANVGKHDVMEFCIICVGIPLTLTLSRSGERGVLLTKGAKRER